jgi:hypothetical protein
MRTPRFRRRLAMPPDMRVRSEQRMLKRLTAIRALQQERAGTVLAGVVRKVEQADANCAAASERLRSARLDWEHLQSRSSLDLAMARTSSRWLVMRTAELDEHERVAEAYREDAEHRRSAFIAALGRRELAVALEKSAARIARRHVEEAALAAAEERTSRKKRS